MIETIDLLGFFTLGVLGSIGHCLGMCSPFVLFVGRRFGGEHDRRRAFTAQLSYNSGRVVTYAVLGAMAGVLGGVVELAGGLVGLHRAASVVAGFVLVASALAALTHLLPSAAAPSVLAGVSGLLRGHVPGGAFATGLFLGLLPCGLLYSALIAAVARGGAVQGATALAVFAAGTVPALLGVSFADHLVARRRVIVNQLSQVFVLVMGAWFLWTGLAL